MASEEEEGRKTGRDQTKIADVDGHDQKMGILMSIKHKMRIVTM